MFKRLVPVVAFLFLGWIQDVTASNIYNATFIPIKEPECVSGRFFVEDDPYHSLVPFNEFNLIVRYLGDDAVAQEVFYPVEVYTGFAPQGERALTQRGSLDLPPPIGSSAFQLECMSGGMMLNTWWFLYGLNPPGAGPHAAFEYKWTIAEDTPLTPGLDPGARAWNPTAVSPWRTETSDLVAQASLRAAWFLPADRNDVPGSPVAQLSLVFYLMHRATRDQIPYVVLAYDNRVSEVFSESLGCDASTSPCLPFVSTRFLDALPDPATGVMKPLRYATKSPYSAASSAELWDELKFFRVHISKENLLNAIDVINRFRYAQGAPLLPREPEDYLLIKIAVLSEVFYNKRVGADNSDISARDNLSFGVSYYGLGAYEAR